ncbi:MAG: hypothetical protein NTW16_15445 [Bacteroidetes bacterium]|nr:hypothetical protein [Bacteroidota bacterium]
MKKVMLVGLFMGLCIMAFSQVVDTTTYVYCRAVSVSQNAFNMNKEAEVDIKIDFGDGKQFNHKNPMKDKDGKDAIFENVVDLLNCMGALKWSLDKVYQVYSGSSNVVLMTSFIFKKPKYSVL